MTVSDHNRRGRLWAVTSYYNPVPYRRRLDNYRIFRERLALPLLTVELAYRAPELGAGDADILVQIPGRDVLWQKERLLNLAIAALPPECDRVAWLDCDIFFEDESWTERLDQKLDECVLVQPFSRVHYLSRDWRPGVPAKAATEVTRISVMAKLASGASPEESLARGSGDRRKYSSPGFAWAARRSLLARHGLYDASITGGGDRLLAGASLRCFDTAANVFEMSDLWYRHYREWAEPWADAGAGRRGVVDVEGMNLWHGEMQYRRAGTERHAPLRGFGYDPRHDIAHDGNGAWRWASDKPELHAYLRDYFVGRREDG